MSRLHLPTPTATLALLLVAGLGACGSGDLSTSSACSDWNNADVNARGTFVDMQSQSGVRGLNKSPGWGIRAIAYYCENNPAANLGDVTRKAAAAPF